MIPSPTSQNNNTYNAPEQEIQEDFFIAGGSSGGSAVAVASGTCVA